MEDVMKELKVTELESGFNPRTQFDKEKLEELAESIKLKGVVQPIIVRQINGTLHIVSGERRLKAVKLLNLPTIPAIVKEMTEPHREGRMKWFRQEGGSCCFPVAIMNACAYRRIKVPRLCHLVRLCKAKHGGAIVTVKVANWAGLDMRETEDYKKVLRYGGILSIMHPIFNLHVVFLYRRKKDYYLVNSWLGPTCIKVALKEFEKYIWNTETAYHWHFVSKQRRWQIKKKSRVLCMICSKEVFKAQRCEKHYLIHKKRCREGVRR